MFEILYLFSLFLPTLTQKMAAQQLTSSLDLFRRLPSQNVAKNLELISPLIISEDVLDELLNSIDSNLLVKLDLINGREFLVSPLFILIEGRFGLGVTRRKVT